MAPTGYRIRLVLVIATMALVVVNSLALWGDEPARRVAAGLEFGIGVGAVVYGLITARRACGVSRTWRLLAVAALACLLAAELAWWTNWEAFRPAGVIAYYLFPLLAFASVLLLAHAGGGVTGSPDRSLRHTVVTTGLDGLVAATSFAIMVIIGGFGMMSTAAFPRSGNPPIEVVYSLLELVLVAFAAVIGMVYRADQPYRAELPAAGERCGADRGLRPSGRLPRFRWCDSGSTVGWGGVRPRPADDRFRLPRRATGGGGRSP